MPTLTTAKYASKNDIKRKELGREPTIKAILSKKSHWTDKERRQAYLEASIEQGIAWQIKLNREAREWSQKELAKRIGTHQSAISRIEDPEYGGYRIETLLKIANAFDCALKIKFVEYSELAVESQKLSELDQIAAPFTAELEIFSG